MWCVQYFTQSPRSCSLPAAVWRLLQLLRRPAAHSSPWSAAPHCILLHRTAYCCTLLHCIALCCTLLHSLHCTTPRCSALGTSWHLSACVVPHRNASVPHVPPSPLRSARCALCIMHFTVCCSEECISQSVEVIVHFRECHSAECISQNVKVQREFHSVGVQGTFIRVSECVRVHFTVLEFRVHFTEGQSVK